MDEVKSADGAAGQVPAFAIEKDCDQLHVGDYSPPAQAVGNAPIILEQAVASLPPFADYNVTNQDFTTEEGGVLAAAAAAVPAGVDSTQQSSDEEEDAAYISGPIDPEQCIASGPGITGGTAGTPISFLVSTKDTSGRFLQEGGAYVVVEIQHQSKGNNQNSVPIEAQIVDSENGSYKASYSVIEKGSYQVDIKINGASITGSPFPVYFSAPIPGEIPLESAGNVAAVFNIAGGGGDAAAEHTAQHVHAYNAILQQEKSLTQQVAELRTAQKFQSNNNNNAIGASAVDVAVAAARRLATGAAGSIAAEKKDSRRRDRSRSYSPGRGNRDYHHYHRHDGSIRDSRRRRSRSRSRRRKRERDDDDRHRHRVSDKRDKEAETGNGDRQRHSSHRRHHSRSRDRKDGSTRKQEDKAAKRFKSSEQETMVAPPLPKEKQQPASGDELEDLLKELEDV